MNPYLDVLKTPGAWRFLLPGMVARLPYAMMQIGVLLLVRWATGSYGAAGVASAAAAVSQAFVGPQTGRLADRHGQRRVLVPQVLFHATALGVLLALAQARAAAPLLIGMSAVAGASMPQVGSMVRARWANLVGGSRLTTAFAIEAIADELTFTAAPVLLVALATGLSPVWALLVALILVLAGTLLFAAVRRGAPTPVRGAAGARRSGVLWLQGVRPLALALLSVGTVFGSLQVGVTSFTAARGHAGAAGPIYATFSAASMMGGLLYGLVRWRVQVARRLLTLLVLLAIAVLGPSLAGDIPPMYAAAALAGFVIAPAVITGYALVEHLVVPEVRTEAFTLLNGAIGLGIAAGAAIAGQLVDALGPGAAFLVPPITIAAGALTVTARLKCLTAAPSRSANAAERDPVHVF